MHYTGTIWRPPYEADSLLLEVTAGCTHHKCKFCTLYSDLPFKFRMTPIEDIESDLLEVQVLRNNPASIITNKLHGLPRPKPIQRVFLTGANPFVLKTDKLLEIAALIRKYLPSVESIGCFARITDSKNKTEEELLQLRVGVVRNLARAGRGTVDRGVVHQHDHAVFGHARVDLEERGHHRERFLERLDAVFGESRHHAAAVAADDDRPLGRIAEPLVQLCAVFDVDVVGPFGLLPARGASEQQGGGGEGGQ